MNQAQKKTSKALRNYIYDLSSITPFVFLLLTGIIVLRYHSGTEQEIRSFGLDGNLWLQIHRIAALIVIPLIIIHLLLHTHWIKDLFKYKLKGKNSGMNLTLFFVFAACAVTALLAWFAFYGKPLSEVLREVHSKLGLLLIFFYIIHVSNYYKWLARMTRKYLWKKN